MIFLLKGGTSAIIPSEFRDLPLQFLKGNGIKGIYTYHLHRISSTKGLDLRKKIAKFRWDKGFSY